MLDVPSLLFYEIGVAAEAARCEHDGACVVLRGAVGAVRVGAGDLAVLHDELRRRRAQVHLYVDVLNALDHGLDVADRRLVVLEPMEGGMESSVVVVDRAAVFDALLKAPVDVLGRLVAQVEPECGVLTVLAAYELVFDDLGGGYVDALFVGHLRIDGEHAFDEACVAAELTVLLDEDEVRTVERRLHRAREAASASADDEQVGIVGFVDLRRCCGRLGLGR